MDSIRSLDYTILICDDLPRSVAFYRDVMKFPIEFERENWVNFRVGSSVLALRTRSAEGGFEDGPRSGGSASVQIAFRVPLSKLEECYQVLEQKRVPIVREPVNLSTSGHHMFLFRDPEGNLLEIYAEL